MGVLEWLTMHPRKSLQILPFQLIWSSQLGPPRNSVPGAGLEVKHFLLLTRFPESFPGIAELGQNVSLHLCTLNYFRLRSISFVGVCLTHVILAPGVCGYGVWAAILETVSEANAGKFQEARFCAQARHKQHICSGSDAQG